MYKTSQFLDGKNAPGKFKIDFQGSELRNCAHLSFWFLWRDYTFDIRTVRKYFKKKEVKKSLDLNYKLHPCSVFQTQMHEIMALVGEHDFEKILLACAKMKVDERKDVIEKNKSNGIKDSLPF